MDHHTVGAFDVGTNSVLLLVAQVHGGVISSVLLDEERVPRLGQGSAHDGELARDAILRTVEAIAELRGLAQQYGVQVWRAVATSATRDAPNSGVLVTEVERRTGITLEVIDGEREAVLSFRGVSGDPATPEGPLIVVDIGGGSTEYMWGMHGDVSFATSVNIGSNRLRQAVASLDPLPQGGVDTLRVTARAAIQSGLRRAMPPKGAHLVVVGGTASTLIAIEQGATDQAEPPNLTRMRLEYWMRLFAESTAHERAQIPGMPPARVDTVVTGTAILLEMLDVLGLASASVSHRGLRYGLAVSA